MCPDSHQLWNFSKEKSPKPDFCVRSNDTSAHKRAIVSSFSDMELDSSPRKWLRNKLQKSLGDSFDYSRTTQIKSCVSFNINRRVSGPLFSETEAFPRPGREDTLWAWGQDAWRETTFNTFLLCCEIQQEIILECMPLAQFNVSVWRQGCSNCSTVWQQLYYIKDAF